MGSVFFPSSVIFYPSVFSDCAVKKTSALGQDDALAEKLWELSEKEVGIAK